MLRLPYMLFFIGILLAGKQDPQVGPPTHAPMPAPITKTYEVGGINRLEFTVTWTDTGREQQADGGGIYCNNRCLGQKHYVHSTCDSSCDSTCTSLHQIELEPGWRYNRSDGSQGEYTSMSDAAQGGQRFGANAPQESIAYTVHTDIQAAFKDAQTNAPKHKIALRYRHFNDKPCSRTLRKIMGRVYDVSVEWKYYRETEVDGKVIRTNGPSGTTPYGQVIIPQENYRDTNYEGCRCNIIEENGETGFIPGGTGTGTGSGEGETKVADGGVRLGEDPSGPLLGDKNLEKIQFGVVCDNMFEGTAYATNPFNMPMSINMAPGTCFDTDEDGVQDVVLMSQVTMNLPPPPASPDGRADPVTAKLRLACLEMSKREPTPKTKYRVLPATDPVLARLAQITSKSRMRGPWDQARIWIYTDAATHEEIKKKLIPSPGANSYVRVMREAADAGLPIGDKRYARCFTPSLLSALDSQPEHLAWFAREVLRRDPGGLLKWAQGESNRYGSALAANADKRDFEAAAALISALCASGSQQGARAGLLLIKGIPADSRSLLMSHDLSPAWALCWSKDAATRKEAMSLLEAYAPPSKDFYISNIKK